MVCNNLFVCGLQISHSRNRIYGCPKARLNRPTHRPIRSDSIQSLMVGYILICELGRQIRVFIHKIFGYQVECEINTFLVGYLTRPITIWMDIRYFICSPDSYELSNGFANPIRPKPWTDLKQMVQKWLFWLVLILWKRFFSFMGVGLREESLTKGIPNYGIVLQYLEELYYWKLEWVI